MKKVLAAWAIWLSSMATIALIRGKLPEIVAGILLLGVPVFCWVLIFLGQRRLPLWLNIALLIVQVAASLYVMVFVILIYAASTSSHI